jgi:hypothetical protein
MSNKYLEKIASKIGLGSSMLAGAAIGAVVAPSSKGTSAGLKDRLKGALVGGALGGVAHKGASMISKTKTVPTKVKPSVSKSSVAHKRDPNTINMSGPYDPSDLTSKRRTIHMPGPGGWQEVGSKG